MPFFRLFTLCSIRVSALEIVLSQSDRLCGLVFGVPGYISRGPWMDSQHYQIFSDEVGQEQGPLSLWV
jgi:hypothetical protein